jgi:hypothetical protein
MEAAVAERKRQEAEQGKTKKRSMFTAFAEALLKKIKKIMIAKKRANLRKGIEAMT